MGRRQLTKLQRLILPLGAPIALVLLTAYALSGVFMSGYPRGYEFLGHFLKAETLQGSLDVFNNDWFDGNFGGYYQFTLYPFLSYLPTVALDSLGFSSLEGVKIEVLLSAILAALGMYYACREILRSEYKSGITEMAAAAGAITFALSPALSNFIFGIGEMPDYVGMTVAPFSLYCLFRALSVKGWAWWTACGVSLTISMLLHPNVLVYVISAIVFYIILTRQINKRNLLGLALAFVVMAGLGAFWIVPYFILDQEIGGLSSRQAASGYYALDFPLLFNREILRGRILVLYLGIVPLALALLGLASQKLRRRALPFVAFLMVGIVVATGWLGFIHEKIPLLRAVDADNALLLVLFGMAFMVALTTQQIMSHQLIPRLAGYGLGLTIIIAIFADLSLTIAIAQSDTQIPSEYSTIAHHIAEQKSDPLQRTMFISDSYEVDAYYTQVTIGNPIVGGNESQSSVNYALKYQIQHNLQPTGKIDRALHLLELLNVRFVIVDFETHQDDIYTLLETKQFDRDVESGRWVVLKRTQPMAPLKSIDSEGNLGSIDSEVTSYEPTHITFSAAPNTDGSIVIPISWSPGWRVAVDESPVAAWNQEGFVSIFLPKGAHSLSMDLETLPVQYWARIFSAAFLVVFSLSAGAVFIIQRRIRKE
jgi:hypothetical protein